MSSDLFDLDRDQVLVVTGDRGRRRLAVVRILAALSRGGVYTLHLTADTPPLRATIILGTLLAVAHTPASRHYRTMLVVDGTVWPPEQAAAIDAALAEIAASTCAGRVGLVISQADRPAASDGLLGAALERHLCVRTIDLNRPRPQPAIAAVAAVPLSARPVSAG